ncbi:hypothetical protein LTR84_006738 [Exophiala bonariae]|uniref:Epoxide hydrolase N-terminal domain-containing protein n=1 Tax=Exophiala bonariae TaxID=1690606 RepID=A0AAV9MZT9_9EURO|nr:hypothetical protein LTR84_006738 [Exophiala bonariae]
MSIKRFHIEISQGDIKRLKEKLALANYPIQDGRSCWRSGAPISDIQNLGLHWLNNFDLQAAISRLNQYPQYLAPVDIDGFGVHNIHFIHQKHQNPRAIPLLFLHGWPGCFLEGTRILPLLSSVDGHDSPSFHVVVPSLINFGFSSGNNSPEFGVSQHAEAYHKLMLILGYDEYVVQSGDVGHLITRFMAMKYGPASCKAYHTNTAWPGQPTADSRPDILAKIEAAPLTEADVAGLQRAGEFMTEGMGYYKQLSTKPRTIGFSLCDSPVGLLAWIYEKLHDWSDDYPWTDDEILTWVTIYYFSKAGPDAAGYIYYAMEHGQPRALATAQSYIDVPLGITRFCHDNITLPKAWNQSLGPVVFESSHEKGGHFAAWEQPDAIVSDLIAMFGRGGPVYGCVKGKDGYAE